MLNELKKIVVVYGTGNTGKTSSIKLALKKMAIVINPSYPRSDLIFIGRISLEGRDLFCGIASGGDTEEIVLENLACFRQSEMELDVLVIACKSYGKSTQAVEAFAEQFDFQPDWIRTHWVENDEQVVQEADRNADEIVRLLRKVAAEL